MKIAGEFTSEQWTALKAKLEDKPSKELWDLAYQCFYRTRVDTRYLNPIAAVQKIGTESGEGFAIVALFCTLVEFLEACEVGRNFRRRKPGEPPLDVTVEYGLDDAKGLFKDFLKEREPFKKLFETVDLENFYSDVRCGLVHEAQTRGGWLIRADASSGVLVEKKDDNIILFRNQLVPTLENYFDRYRQRLLKDSKTQEAFKRKFDHLSKG